LANAKEKNNGMAPCSPSQGRFNFDEQPEFSLVAQEVERGGSQRWNSLDNHGFTELSLAETLAGGQSFVWEQDAKGEWQGVIKQAMVSLRLDGDSMAWQAKGSGSFTTQDLLDYLWIDHTYQEAVDALPWRSDSVLAKCLNALPGLRILRQPLDETLFYFLLSPVKSIPQIKETGTKVAEIYGPSLGSGRYGFPGWSRLAEVSEEKFRELKMGYRAKNISGCARFLKSHPGWLDGLQALSYEEARAEIMRLPGVGGKIADCVLLFGAGKLQSFPIDTWIDKVLTHRYHLEDWTLKQKLAFARIHFGDFAGLAQQFFFSAERLKLL
jgi:N-glycosylase/DNA lyase